jgi:cyclin-C
MAANYWNSTQRKSWMFTNDKLTEIRDELDRQFADLVRKHPFPDRRLMFIFLRDRLLQLGKRAQFRQQCVATAMVYMHRFFLTTPMQNVNLYLLISTAFYLASKTEECPHHIRLVASEARQSWADFVPSDVSRIGEMEFCLISEMRSQLIVWHPYRTLIELKENKDLKLTSDELGLAWCIINDSFMTDLPLTCPPHLVAIIAVFLAIIFFPYSKAPLKRQMSSDLSSTMDSGSFPTLGGRSGMAGVLGSAMQGTGMNPPSTSQGANGYTGMHARPSTTDATRGVPAETNGANGFQNTEKFRSMLKFLLDSDIALKPMGEGIQEIISLYEIWEQYDEKDIKDRVAKSIHPEKTGFM